MEGGTLPRFFERVTRQTFADLAIDDGPAARYVADVLTRFARAEALHPVSASGRRLECVVDALLEVQRAWDVTAPEFDPGREPALRRHVGDYTLFMTGIFCEHVERMAATRHYRETGARAYRFVGETARARGEREAPLFLRLAERFEHYAGALAYMRKVYLHGETLPWRQWPPPPGWPSLTP